MTPPAPSREHLTADDRVLIYRGDDLYKRAFLDLWNRIDDLEARIPTAAPPTPAAPEVEEWALSASVLQVKEDGSGNRHVIPYEAVDSLLALVSRLVAAETERCAAFIETRGAVMSHTECAAALRSRGGTA